ncbi:LTA synthase family protein [Paenibacillus bouchesdurhonensis]|uniref:LTA synthase family protein n=1 Tax=Paenibacillus bouchesdurhonensis TaxID=1870990 RepID=UPI000DA63B3E|nr:LTA synthase family protein [Paenibacillus bouchesdurhonensis]
MERIHAWYKSKLVMTGLLFVLKLMLLRMFFFGEIYWSGLPGELLAVLGLLCLVELLTPDRAKAVVYWSLNAIFSFLLFSTALYYAHFGTVPTYAVLSGLNQVPQVRASVSALLRPEQFLFFADFVLAAGWQVIRALRRRRKGSVYTFMLKEQTSRKWAWNTVVTVLLLISAASSLYYVRQGKLIDNELVRAEKVGFLNYQVVAAISSREEDQMIAEGNIEETKANIEKLQSSYPYRTETDAVDGMRSPDYFGIAEGMNLIVIQMESFQNFPINLKLNNGAEVTPVLNKLAGEGIYFPHIYQQIGQGNTSDAEFMFNTSIYPTAAVAMSTGYGDRELPSLPRLLQQQGYTANTFHVNNVTFWDRNKLYPALNFNQYYDKPAFNNDHFNDYGASDEEMYRVGVEKMKDLHARNKRFYAQFVTTSSHSPFVVPESFQQIELPAELEGTNLGNYMNAIHYTDYAIGELIGQLKEADLWDNTMLVFYGDHFGLQPKETSAQEIEAQLGVPYDDTISRFNIPFIIHVPGKPLGIVSERAGGQVDMLPTVANILGLSLKREQFTAFGQDLLNIDRNLFGVRYYLPTGSFFNDEIMFIPGQGFEDGQAISIKTLEPVADFAQYRQDYEYVTSLMKLSDEYVKLLPKRR